MVSEIIKIMPDTFCEHCRKEFYYDVKIGLNVVYHEAEATRTHFRAGGDFPCCPLCEKRCDFEPPAVQVKISRGFIDISECFVKKKI